MIGAAATSGIAGHQPGPITSPSMVLSAIDIPAGRSGRLCGVQLDDGTWTIGHRTGYMIRMPNEAAAWVAECMAIMVAKPGLQQSFRRGVLWALYNPADQIFNLTAGAVIVCVEDIDNIRVVARWMEAALS